MKTLLIAVATLGLFTSCRGQEPVSPIKTETVKEVDIQRYLGRWYEIARFDHSFERGLTGVTATYSLRKDGKIKVLNEGYKRSLKGRYSKAVGKAYIPDPSDNSRLKVSFFLNFYADYLILELDSENYGYAMIGSNSPNFLWILSRTPKLPDDILDELLRKARERGYDTSRLIMVEQQ